MDESPPSASEEPVPEEPSEHESYRWGRKRVSGVVAGIALVVTAAAAFARYRPARVAIEGISMAPTLVPEDWVLVVTPVHFDRDDVVVVEHPERPGYEIVKRLVAVPGDEFDGRILGPDEYWVEGDFAEHSTDSRAFGPVGRSKLKAKAILIYWPLDRRRVVR